MGEGITLKRWLGRYWICVLVFCGILFYILQNIFLGNLAQEVEKNQKRSMEIAQEHVENSLDMADSFIYETYSNSNSMLAANPFYIMKYSDSAFEISTAKGTILQLLQSLVSWSDMVDGIIVYNDNGNEEMILDAGTASSYAIRRELKDDILDMVNGSTGIAMEPYMVYQIGGENYLLRNMKLEDFYFSILVSEKKVLQTIQTAKYDENSIAFISDHNGDVIFSSEELDISLPSENEGTYIKIDNREYLQTGYISGKTGYYFGLLTEKESISHNLWKFRQTFLIFFLVLMYLVPISIYVIHKALEQPLGRIVEAMQQIENGSLNIIVQEHSTIREFSQAIQSFNHMVARIQELKIENYEIQLSEQKITMQYLMKQVSSHFYANILNMIYSLAETKDYTKIQRIAVCVGRYSRYMFHDAMELVELERELEHVHDYIEIQKIRYGEQVTFKEKMESNIQDTLIPPFVIQGFVENSMKYAFSTQKEIKISVKVYVDQKKQKLMVEVRDNGDGYPNEILNNWRKKQKEGHIGLYNIFRRMELIYETDADVTLFNENGAVAKLSFPYIAVGTAAEADIREE